MADRIADNWSNVVTPVIVSIADDDFSINLVAAKGVQVGGFTWSLVFNWHTPTRQDKENKTSPVSPVRYVIQAIVNYRCDNQIPLLTGEIS